MIATCLLTRKHVMECKFDEKQIRESKII